jgi:hypothetical protein
VKAPQIALLLLAASMMSPDSIAGPDAGTDAGPAKVVIPPLVEEATLPAFDAEPFPAEKSTAPKAGEWKEAPRVRLSRVPERVTSCNAYRVREWMKIDCHQQTAGVRLLAGSTDGITLWVPDPDPDGDAQVNENSMAEVIFPVRSGDRRVFETVDLEFGDWDGWGTGSSVLIEERWLPGAKNPEIALLSP